MLCAAFHRAGKSREYTVESQNSRVAKGEESLAQVLLEQSRGQACGSFRSLFQTSKSLLREARLEYGCSKFRFQLLKECKYSQ